MGRWFDGSQSDIWQRIQVSSMLDMSLTEEKNGFDYMTYWSVVGELNRIFGPDGWDSEVVVAPHQVYGEWGHKSAREGNNQVVKRMYRCGWSCTIRCIFRWADGKTTTHTGTGFCSGMVYGDRYAPKDHDAATFTDIEGAVDMASKGSESDALKRAVHKLGWALGLALYQNPKKSPTGKRFYTYPDKNKMPSVVHPYGTGKAPKSEAPPKQDPPPKSGGQQRSGLDRNKLMDQYMEEWSRRGHLEGQEKEPPEDLIKWDARTLYDRTLELRKANDKMEWGSSGDET